MPGVGSSALPLPIVAVAAFTSVRLHRDFVDVCVPVGFEDALGVRAIGLVPGEVGSDLVRRQDDDLVAEFLGPPTRSGRNPSLRV